MDMVFIIANGIDHLGSESLRVGTSPNVKSGDINERLPREGADKLQQGVEVELSGPCAGGEPQRVDCRSDDDARGWVSRARRCAVDA